MSTYKLWELTAPASTSEVNQLAQLVVEDRIAKGQHNWYRLPNKDFDEEAVSLCYAVHRALWNVAKVPDNTKAPYTHRTIEGTSMNHGIRSAVGTSIDPSSPQGKYFIQRVYTILVANQLAVRIGGGGRSNYYYLRAWPQGFMPRWAGPGELTWLSQRDEADVARQQQRAEELAGPVVAYRSVSAIPLPEPNPQSVMAYLDKVVAAAKALEAENADLRLQVSQSSWQGVVDKIAHDLGGDDDPNAEDNGTKVG